MQHSRFPVRSVDVMRHTERHTDKVSESTINDLWTEAKSLNLSEVWTGTTRFQILRARLPEGYKRESGKPTKSKKQLPDQTIFCLKLGRSYPKKQSGKRNCRMEESAKLHAARRNKRIYEVSFGDKDVLKVTAEARPKLEKDNAPAMRRTLRHDSGQELRARSALWNTSRQ